MAKIGVDIPHDYIIERFEAFNSLPANVKTYLFHHPAWVTDSYLAECGLHNFVLCIGTAAIEMKKCGSPIEMLLFVALEGMRHRNSVMDIELQKELVCNGRKYRADFLVSFYNGWLADDITPDLKYLVVECDGHDYHERTKAQAARDKRRDRDMQLEGYSVLRFTGSEIYKNPDSCAEEISQFIEKLLAK